MSPFDDLDTLLALALLNPTRTRQLVEKTAANLMPFTEPWPNLVLAAIHELHARDLPVDIITVSELLIQRTGQAPYAEMLAMLSMPILEPLRDRGICIRPLQGGDVWRLVAAVRESVATVGTWLPWCHSGYSAVEAVAWMARCKANLRSQTAYDLGVFSADESELYGGIAINLLSRPHRIGRIGCWIRQSCQQRGIASNAVRAIAGFGFGALGLNRLEIVVAEGNGPGHRLAERVGATIEGVANDRPILNDLPGRAAVFSLVRKDIPGHSP